MNIADYNHLKQQADLLRRQADQAAGALAQLNSQAKEKFGTDDLGKLKKLLAKEQKVLTGLEAKGNKMLEEFRCKWASKIGG